MNARKVFFHLISISSSILLLFSYVNKKEIIHSGVSTTPKSWLLLPSTGIDTTKNDSYHPLPPSSLKSKQRVVLFAGPHKTGSTSIEYNLLQWIRNVTHPSGLAGTWSWPSPIKAFIDDELLLCEKMEHKVFYWWIQALCGAKTIKCLNSSHYEDEHFQNEMIDRYKTEFYNEWMNGKSLVVATEAMDFVGGNEELLDKIIQQLPWNADFPVKGCGGNDDITVVVTYRSPRVKHLESMWHQCCMRKGISFYRYLVDPESKFHKSKFNSFDSLRLVETFLDRGLTVTLVDMEGVIKKGYDISNIMACDILGANCNADKTFTGMEGIHTEIMNIKNDHDLSSNVNVTSHQLEQIDSAILRYDCARVSVLGHPNVTVLHSYGIEKMIEFCCSLDDGERIMTMRSLQNKISAIVQN